MEKQDLTVDGIVFKETECFDSFLSSCIDIIHPQSTVKYAPNLEGRDDKSTVEAGENVIHFDSERDVYYVGMGYFAIAYKSPNQRGKDKTLFSQIPIKLTPTLQTPEIVSHFEYNGKYWLLLSAERKLLGETNDVTLYGLILNPEKHLEQNEVGALQKGFSDRLKPFER